VALPAPSDDNVLQPELNKQKEKVPINKAKQSEHKNLFLNAKNAVRKLAALGDTFFLAMVSMVETPAKAGAMGAAVASPSM
jgi:hypothetical protein